jgi:hypothetical protein
MKIRIDRGAGVAWSASGHERFTRIDDDELRPMTALAELGTTGRVAIGREER